MDDDEMEALVDRTRERRRGPRARVRGHRRQCDRQGGEGRQAPRALPVRRASSRCARITTGRARTGSASTSRASRRRPPGDPHLQHPIPDEREPRQRDAAPAGRAAQYRRREGLERQSRPVPRAAAPAAQRIRGDDRRRRLPLHHAGAWRRRRHPRLRARQDRAVSRRVRADDGERSSGSARGVVAARDARPAPLQGGQPHAHQALPVAPGPDRLAGVPAAPDADHARAGRRSGPRRESRRYGPGV